MRMPFVSPGLFFNLCGDERFFLSGMLVNCHEKCVDKSIEESLKFFSVKIGLLLK